MTDDQIPTARPEGLSEDEAWDALWETYDARCCDCPACNHYLPHTAEEAERVGVAMYDPSSTCVMRAAVEQILAARTADLRAEVGRLTRAVATLDRTTDELAADVLRVEAERDRLAAAVERVRALTDEWADQPTDFDEDTEQQIEDGRAHRAALDPTDPPTLTHGGALTGSESAGGPECRPESSRPADRLERERP